uniref:Chitin-binding type-2 domain-containing protein n=1 Tax=Anopheles atroparvus TaxID=41427 RepID=A0A182JFJ9_ANOAO
MKLYLAVIAATLHLVQGQGSSPCVPGVTCPSFNCVADSRCPLVNPPQGPILLPHTSCTKFYKCSNGEACEYDCPANLHYNVNEQACDWPERACCDPAVPCQPQDPCVPGVTCPPPGVPTAPPPPVPTAPPPPVPTAPPPPVPTAPSPTVPTPPPPPVPTAPTPPPPPGPCVPGTCPNQNCVPDVRCPINENPDNPTVFPHENDCTLFYKCSLGQRCVIPCLPGQHFSPTHGHCEWPNVACCDPTIPCTGPNPGAVCEPYDRCPLFDNPDNPTVFPHETNCGMFYKCDLGRRCLLQCSAGHFSPATGRCELPNVACCDPTIPCTGPSVCEPDVNCPLTDNPNNPTVFGHGSDCSLFYKCDFGKRCLQQCSFGHFSNTTGRCEWPNEACCDPTVPCTGPNPGVTCRIDSRCPPFEDPFNPTLLPHSTSCTRFYKCSGGQACDLACPAGQHFSEVLQRCDSPDIACCDPTIPCQNPCIPGVTCPPGPIPPTIPPPTIPPTLPPPTMPPTLPPPTIPPTLPPPTIPPTLPPPATTPSDPCIPGVTCPPSDAGNCIAHPDCPSVNGPTVTLLPHANCPMFYKCNNGLACEMNCPAGYVSTNWTNSGTANSTATDPTTANSATANSASANPATTNTASSNSATTNPTASNPATTNPATSNPATTNPSTTFPSNNWARSLYSWSYLPSQRFRKLCYGF